MLQINTNIRHQKNIKNIQKNEGILHMPRKNKSITFRCDERLSNKLTKVAILDNISVGELCRNLLERSLLNEQNKHQKVNRQKNLQKNSSNNKEN